jgi:serine/threonine-protein kinase RsbT
MASGRQAHDLPTELISLLEPYVPPLRARAIVRAAIAKAKAGCEGTPTPKAILEQLASSTTMMIAPSLREAALASIRARVAALEASGPAGPTPAPTPAPSSVPAPDLVCEEQDAEEMVVPIRGEYDLNAARMFAREACHLVGIRGYPAQKIITAVSEIARNIARYVGEGEVRFRIDPDLERIVVVAEDRGGGIAQIDLILAGEYRSRTGLGRGILGVKNLADHFEIQTGNGGTKITLGFDY